MLKLLEVSALVPTKQMHANCKHVQNIDFGFCGFWESNLRTQNAIEPGRGKHRLIAAAHLRGKRLEGTHLQRSSLVQGMNGEILIWPVCVRKVVLGIAKVVEPYQHSERSDDSRCPNPLRQKPSVLHSEKNFDRFRASQKCFSNPNLSFAGSKIFNYGKVRVFEIDFDFFRIHFNKPKIVLSDKRFKTCEHSLWNI